MDGDCDGDVVPQILVSRLCGELCYGDAPLSYSYVAQYFNPYVGTQRALLKEGGNAYLKRR